MRNEARTRDSFPLKLAFVFVLFSLKIGEGFVRGSDVKDVKMDKCLPTPIFI